MDREIGNRTEFVTGNGGWDGKWETIQYEKHNFQQETGKATEYRHNTTQETLFSTGNRKKENKYRHGKDAREYNMEEWDSGNIWVFGKRPKILFGIGNDVFPTVTEWGFRSKSDVSSHP